MTVSQTIGEKIRYLRIKKGLSQEQLALNAGMNTSYLGQIERGDKNPTINTLEKIARGLDLTIEQLIANSEKESVNTRENNAVLTVLTSEEIKRLIVDAIRNNSGQG